jgi:hypothetical protein
MQVKRALPVLAITLFGENVATHAAFVLMRWTASALGIEVP